MRWFLLFGSILFSLLPSILIGGMDLKIRDAHTGEGLPARVLVNGLQEYETDTGILQVEPEHSPFTLRIESVGYKSLGAEFLCEKEEDLPVTFWLDPVEPYRTYFPEIETGVDDQAFLCGRVMDDRTLKALSGATVEVEEYGISMQTGPEGIFSLYVPAETLESDRAFPTLTLRVRLEGYASLERTFLPAAGTTRFLLDLHPVGPYSADILDHKFLAPLQDQEEGQIPPSPEKIQRQPAFPLYTPVSRSSGMAPLLISKDPPSTIRVGTSCSCTSCASVDVVSMETYVQRGLNDEWISSWSQHSLRSGAVAYRSYGAYYVEHPISGTYDICSTTCCQVYDTDTATSTNTAGARTAGILLQRGGLTFRSEYSAENNAWDDPNDGLNCSNGDLSCGDGYAGSPSTSWPCLSDSLCAGHGCFGHGRGMCQWGTQRWALTGGRLFNWITNHYYNASGSGTGYRTAQMTAPFELPSAAPNPSEVEAGSSFTIQASADNLADLSHDWILIGASIYSPSTGYISDPPGDTAVSLVPGLQSTSRPFAVPAGTPEGSYDLITSLWLDTDENGAITGDDLALISRTDTGVLSVVPPVAGTCDDPYIFDPLPATRSGSTSGGDQFLDTVNCASTRDLSGPERVYEFTLSSMGTLQATLTPSDPLDLYLLQTCDPYTCQGWADSSLTLSGLPAGTYLLVVDGPSAGSYDLSVTFTPGDSIRPRTVQSLRADKTGGKVHLSWDPVTEDVLDHPEVIDHSDIWRGTGPSGLAPYDVGLATSYDDDVLTDGISYYYRASPVDNSGNRAYLCPEQTLDDPDAVYTGTWSESSTQPDVYGSACHRITSAGAGDVTARYRLSNICDGPYTLYLWHPASADQCNAVPYLIQTSGGPVLASVDLTSNGGLWVPVGAYDLSSPASEVTLSDLDCPAVSFIVADGLRAVPELPTEVIMDEDQANFTGTWSLSYHSEGYDGDYAWQSTGGTGADYARWIPILWERDLYDIYVWYRSGTNRTTVAPYTVVTADGPETVLVDQSQNGSQWVYLGSWILNPESVSISVSDDAPSGKVVIADAVRFVRP
ncbi:MAG TPA: SpoIID/LytB domain-containing protein [Thermoanaerobaculia bacterium]|nr:SpoIID/LytB domain-containing protein [Thermoanaerobaculia bacterium]HUM30011.1 SpoIID/LytB domain-containing protein [Thermoanaerobaculia bacterium]HXK68300.1 SpoIID/LytB domain-containing protein [Thermoanaerobaculia bacterium]